MHASQINAEIHERNIRQTCHGQYSATGNLNPPATLGFQDKIYWEREASLIRDKNEAIKAAKKARANKTCEYPGGYVITKYGNYAVWTLALDNPRGWEPACIAVSEDGEAYIASGGNDYDGAQRWEKMA